nr:MAG TPA: Intracellular delivery domain [Caudoviricetes sp.]
MKVTKEILQTLKVGERISCIIPKNCKKNNGVSNLCF